MVEVKKCLYCGNEFEIKIKNGGRKKKFCSPKCQCNYWIKNTDKGINWYKRKLQKLKEKQEFKFHCLVCNHIFNTKGKNKSKHPYNCPSCKSNNWDFGSNIQCICCGRTCLTPVIHHVDGNHKNNYKENRIPVCQDCHTAIHHGIGIQNANKKRGSGGKSKTRMYGFYNPVLVSRKHNPEFEVINNIKKYQSLLNRGNISF